MELFKLKNKNLLPFRFKKLKSWKYFLSTDYGDWIVLKEDEFRSLIEWKKLDDNLKQLLISKNILRNTKEKPEDLLKRLAWRWLLRHWYLLRGPSLHIVVVTLACNQSCRYCHASAPWKGKEYHMSKEMAKKVVDVIFQTTSGDVTIEFQWWEPLMNWEVVKFIIEYAREKNKKYNLNLQFALVSNFTLMDEEKFEYLLAEDIWVSTSLDWPKDLHDWNRPWTGGSAYEKVIYWIKRFNEEYKKRWWNKKIGVIATATRKSLWMRKEIVDTYVEAWLDRIFIRPLNPYGFAQKIWDKIGYSGKEYINFYKRMLLYIQKLQQKGIDFKDVYTDEIIKSNMCSLSRVNYMEARNPCWAVLWQLAYNWDWKVYTCDEGRMLGAVWDDTFLLTNVILEEDVKLIRKKIVSSWITKVMLYSSLIDFVPGYETNPISNYCWLCPIYSYIKSGNLISKYKKEEREQIDEFVLQSLLWET